MTGREDLKKTTIPPPPAGPTSCSNWRGLSRDEYPAGVARRIEESSEQWCQLSVTASKSKFPSRSDCIRCMLAKFGFLLDTIRLSSMRDHRPQSYCVPCTRYLYIGIS